MIKVKAKLRKAPGQCYESRHNIYPTSNGTEMKKGSTLELGLKPLGDVNSKCLLHASFVPGLVCFS